MCPGQAAFGWQQIHVLLWQSTFPINRMCIFFVDYRGSSEWQVQRESNYFCNYLPLLGFFLFCLLSLFFPWYFLLWVFSAFLVLFKSFLLLLDFRRALCCLGLFCVISFYVT
jgi:hypothetical protein